MEQHLQIRLPGVRAQVCWEGEAVGAALRDILQYFGIQHSGVAAPGAGEPEGAPGERPAAPRVTLCFSPEEPVSVPAGAAQAARFDAGIVAWRAEGRIFLAAGAATVRLDPAAGTGTGDVGALFRGKPGQQGQPLPRARRRQNRREMTGLLVLSLFILLRRQHAFYPLHAAALAKEDDGAAGVLFIGKSGAGKSTMAYSLVRRGWSYLSDDSVLLKPGPAGIEALPFRRKFGLEPAAAEAAFPELAAAPWGPRLTGEEKRSLPVEALRPAQAAARCRPRLLVFPEITGRAESELRPVSKAEAMHATAGQSALVTLDPEEAPRHLGVLKRLVGHTRHVRLLAGRDLKKHPLRVADLISPLM